MPERYIGLMSGTSMDGIDAVLAEFEDRHVAILACAHTPYPDPLKERLMRARATPLDESIHDVDALDQHVGECFRDAALSLLDDAGMSRDEVTAIGSHGQTVRHCPNDPEPFSLQIGNPALIAAETGIDTVADFRSDDIAEGGQGAPLVPPFHDWLFGKNLEERVVVNIGGIANITVLPGDERPVTGFDTGPGNTLLDAWAARHLGRPFDDAGHWAASGEVSQALLGRLLDDEYFRLDPPKSTGFEYFNIDWLLRFDTEAIDPVAVQATLAELTARSIANAIAAASENPAAVFICGGGARNTDLVARLDRCLPGCAVESTATAGLDPDWVEATAFAWLARQRLAGRPGNIPSVTGARRAVTLGTVHRAPENG